MVERTATKAKANIVFVAILAFSLHGVATADTDFSNDSTTALVRKYYDALLRDDGLNACRLIGEEMRSRGLDSEDRSLRARGLIRIAFCEIRFGTWKGIWRKKLKICERLCEKHGSIEHAELLMFRGHMARWRPNVKLKQGISDLESAIVIARQLEDNILHAEAEFRLAQLLTLEGHASTAQSHALLALKISNHCEYETGVSRSLAFLVRTLYNDRQYELALPYARRLLKISPENLHARTVVSQLSEPQKYVEELREKLDSFPETGLSARQHTQKARYDLVLANTLLEIGKAEEACHYFSESALHFEAAGNPTNYVDAKLLKYLVCVENDIPFDYDQPFFESLKDTDRFDFLPQKMMAITRILHAIDRPEVAAEIGEKLKTASLHNYGVEFKRVDEAMTQQLELDLSRRKLAREIEEEKTSTRNLVATLVGVFLLFSFLLLILHLVANRRALRKLEKEIKNREAAQAKSVELSHQLLQTQKLDALGTFSAGIAHDFNNTLQAIMSMTEMLQLGIDEDSSELEYVKAIQEVTQQGSALTRGMLVFSQTHGAEKTNQDLIALVGETESMVRRIVPASITISSEVACSSPTLSVEMNDSQIKQMLLNLVINAKDAMPDGGELSIRIRESQEAPVRAEIIVSDTGVGMTKEVKTKIFEPFFTTKGRGQGTGLGMSMAHGIVKDHGGSIAVKSSLGAGTQVTIQLPTATPKQDERQETVTSKFDSNGGVVLLTEDNEQIRKGVKLKLEHLGFEVLEAKDGFGALEAHSEMLGDLDLIMMDIDLPGLNGRECLQKLREKGETAPAIFMTGLSPNQIDGVVLPKPFSESALLQAITNVQQATTA